MSSGTRRATRLGAGGAGRRTGVGLTGVETLDCATTAGFAASGATHRGGVGTPQLIGLLDFLCAGRIAAGLARGRATA